MPFRSASQRRRFYAMYNRGEISKATLDKWEAETPKKLPERVKKNNAKKAGKTQKAKRKTGK